jgi:hypothetical protein
MPTSRTGIGAVAISSAPQRPYDREFIQDAAARVHQRHEGHIPHGDGAIDQRAPMRRVMVLMDVKLTATAIIAAMLIIREGRFVRRSARLTFLLRESRLRSNRS